MGAVGERAGRWAPRGLDGSRADGLGGRVTDDARVGGPGWHVDPTSLRPVLDDEPAFRAHHGDDPFVDALVLLWTGRPREAEAALATTPCPERRRRALLADAWRDQGRHAEALAAYERLVGETAGTPSEATMRQHRGKALLAAGRPGEAVRELSAALAARTAAGADDDLVASSRLALARARAVAGDDRVAGLPPWPGTPPTCGAVVLRPFTEGDVPTAVDLATDPYVPLIGSLPADATPDDARAWVRRQGGRWAEGAGFSFAIALAATGRAVGAAGLWLPDLRAGRASAGYAVAPADRGHGYAADALGALTDLAWTVAGLDRVELLVEPWNEASLRTARRAGYHVEGFLPRHTEIGGLRRDMLLLVATRSGQPSRD